MHSLNVAHLDLKVLSLFFLYSLPQFTPKQKNVQLCGSFQAELLQPANVLLCLERGVIIGTLAISDFGTAFTIKNMSDPTGMGKVGTLEYMAPEINVTPPIPYDLFKADSN